MTTQEKINQLALEALEKDSSVQPASKPSARSQAGLTEDASPEVVAAVAAMSSSVSARTRSQAPDIDPEVRQLIETRDVRLKKKRARVSLVASLCLLGTLSAAASWVAFSVDGQHKWKELTAAIKESKGDFKSLSHILSNYDKQLQQIAVQSARVDEATRALGVDPSKDDGSGLDLNAEMKKMEGPAQGGPTTIERDQKLQEKLGVVSKLAGRDAQKLKDGAQSDVKF